MDSIHHPKPTVDYVLLHESAIEPRYASPHAAGMDLFAPHDVVLPPKSRVWVDISVAFAIPDGYHGKIWARSGLSGEGVDKGAGLIDSDYRGPVKVLLLNSTENAVTIKRGRACAQMIIEKHERFRLEQVDKLEPTERGAGGFGSTDSKTKRDRSPVRKPSLSPLRNSIREKEQEVAHAYQVLSDVRNSHLEEKRARLEKARTKLEAAKKLVAILERVISTLEYELNAPRNTPEPTIPEIPAAVVID